MAKKQKTALVMHVQPSTARVKVDRMLRHPLYEKAYRTSKSLLAHVSGDLALSVGDTVTIEEIRPVSKRKAWTVTEVRSRKSEVGSRLLTDTLSDSEALTSDLRRPTSEAEQL